MRSRVGLRTAGLCLLVLAVMTAGSRAFAEFRTGLEVDIRRFTGSWYEFARTPNEFEDPQKRQGGRVYSRCFNVRTRYTLTGPGELGIRSLCSRRSQQGEVIQEILQGKALVREGTGNRKLKVAFGSAASRAVQRLVTGGGKNYWIYCLGPVDRSGRYRWAVTGGPKRRFVFLLTRQRNVSADTRAAMLACARREGVAVDRLMFLQD